MDTVMEHIVQKKLTAVDYVISSGIVILATLLLLLVIAAVPQLFIPAAVIVVWGAFKLITRRNLEFEYIYTNGEIDIDKVINKKSRRRIITVDCRSFDLFAPAAGIDNSKLQSMGVSRTIHAEGSLDSPDAHVAVLSHKGVKTAVFFEPNGKMIEEINRLQRIRV